MKGITKITILFSFRLLKTVLTQKRITKAVFLQINPEFQENHYIKSKVACTPILDMLSQLRFSFEDDIPAKQLFGCSLVLFIPVFPVRIKPD